MSPAARKLIYLKCSGRPALTNYSPLLAKTKHTQTHTHKMACLKTLACLPRLICSYAARVWLCLLTAGMPERPILVPNTAKQFKSLKKREKERERARARDARRGGGEEKAEERRRLLFTTYRSEVLACGFFIKSPGAGTVKLFFFRSSATPTSYRDLKTNNPPPTCPPSAACSPLLSSPV